MVQPSPICSSAIVGFIRYGPLRTAVVATLPFMPDLRRTPLLLGASCLPIALATALAALTFVDDAGRNPTVVATLLTAAAALVAWNLWLIVRARRTNRALTLDVSLRKQHYVQACAQGSVLLYWGWYWRPVYDFAPLIAAQLVFAYAFDMLLSWTRRDG